jgi:hypothetical protein
MSGSFRALAAAATLLAACGSLAGSPGGALPSPSPAPTPRVAEGLTQPQVTVPVAGLCTPTLTGPPGSGPVLVALADRVGSGVVFLLDANNGTLRGRIDLSSTPEAAVDWTNGRLLTFCGAELVAFDLASLREQWRIPIEHRAVTKAPGGQRALTVGGDGRLVFVLHYRTLRPGDAYAPGNSITWLTGHDARTGAELGRVDFPDCVGHSVFAASGAAAYVQCRDVLHAVDPVTWSVARTFSYSNAIGPAAMLGERALYGVTRELGVLALDLQTGGITPICCKTTSTSATAQSWDRLAMGPGGLSLWVIAKVSEPRNEFDPDTLAVFNLRGVNSVFAMPVPGLRGVGVVGSRVVYGAGGSLRSTDGVIDRALIDGRVDFWHIFGDPGSS